MTTLYTTTLLDVVRVVNAYTKSDEETVATVAYLINSGKVRLCGAFTGAKLDVSTHSVPRRAARTWPRGAPSRAE